MYVSVCVQVNHKFSVYVIMYTREIMKAQSAPSTNIIDLIHIVVGGVHILHKH